MCQKLLFASFNLLMSLGLNEYKFIQWNRWSFSYSVCHFIHSFIPIIYLILSGGPCFTNQKDPMNVPLYLKITWQCDVWHIVNCQRYNEFGSSGLLFIVHCSTHTELQHSKNLLTCICRHCLLLSTKHITSQLNIVCSYYDVVVAGAIGSGVGEHCSMHSVLNTQWYRSSTSSSLTWSVVGDNHCK